MKSSENITACRILPRVLLWPARYLSLLVICLTAYLPRASATTPVTNDAWLMDAKIAVRIFHCGDQLCGRLIWLVKPRDAQGALNRDRHNPDIALRQRPLCGLLVLWALRPKGPQQWQGGWFYNPFDGKTYRVSATLKSTDLLVARVYRGIPLLGKTKILQRVPHGTTDGWC